MRIPLRPNIASKARRPRRAELAWALMLLLIAACRAAAGADPSAEAAALPRRAAADRAALQAATEQVALVRSRLTDARQQLDQFVRDQYAALNAASGAASEMPASAVSREIEPVADAAPPTPEDLERKRLSARLAELNDERDRLLLRLTSEHPHVQDVETQLGELRRAIAAMPPVAPLLAEIAPRRAYEATRFSERQQKWQSLVADAAVGARQLEANCRTIERELVQAEDTRARAEKNYLASSAAMAANSDWGDPSSAAKMRWAAVALAGSCGLGLAAVALRRLGQRIGRRDCTIRSTADIERLFRLPVAGIITATGPAATLTVGRTRRGMLLALQLLVAIVVYFLVATTIEDPAWLESLALHPQQTLSQALGNLGGR